MLGHPRLVVGTVMLHYPTLVAGIVMLRHPRSLWLKLPKQNSIFRTFILSVVLTPKRGPLPMIISPRAMFTSPTLSSCRTKVIFILLTLLHYITFQHSLQSCHTSDSNTNEFPEVLSHQSIHRGTPTHPQITARRRCETQPSNGDIAIGKRKDFRDTVDQIRWVNCIEYIQWIMQSSERVSHMKKRQMHCLTLQTSDLGCCIYLI